jgi:hydrogenase-4 membrane subunit HyfE
MGLFFILLAFMPIVYNWYNTYSKHVPALPMQNSLLQTFAFILFLMSMFCVASMLPCGRYYYEPEGGYVGNP